MGINKMFDLRGKVAVVTGSSRGIGRSSAELLAAMGAKVVVSSRSEEACATVVDAIRAAGGEAMAIACHIGKRDQLQALVDKTVSEWGGIDILVCNAAINPAYGPMSALTDDAFDKIFATNVRSTVNLCNMVLPGMAGRGGGSVIILSSITALVGNTVIGAYGMSKAAEAALTRNLALEWGPKNCRTNAIAPGLIKTDFARALWEDPDKLKQTVARNPLGRIGEPEDIAGIVGFLASDAGAYVNGQVIVADGGESVNW